jgi:predicted O-methyltransferase YrrM
MEHPRSGMCSPPDSVPLLQLLMRSIGAKKVAEVGVFTGAAALPAAWQQDPLFWT